MRAVSILAAARLREGFGPGSFSQLCSAGSCMADFESKLLILVLLHGLVASFCLLVDSWCPGDGDFLILIFKRRELVANCYYDEPKCGLNDLICLNSPDFVCYGRCCRVCDWRAESRPPALLRTCIDFCSICSNCLFSADSVCFIGDYCFSTTFGDFATAIFTLPSTRA